MTPAWPSRLLLMPTRQSSPTQNRGIRAWNCSVADIPSWTIWVFSAKSASTTAMPQLPPILRVRLKIAVPWVRICRGKVENVTVLNGVKTKPSPWRVDLQQHGLRQRHEGGAADALQHTVDHKLGEARGAAAQRSGQREARHGDEKYIFDAEAAGEPPGQRRHVGGQHPGHLILRNPRYDLLVRPPADFFAEALALRYGVA